MENETRVCLLAKDINTCPNFDGAGHCMAPKDGCGMLQIEPISNKEPVREPKWYEKYY